MFVKGNKNWNSNILVCGGKPQIELSKLSFRGIFMFCGKPCYF